MAKKSQNWSRAQRIKSDAEMISALHSAALKYKLVRNKKVIFISSDGPDTNTYEAYEAYFGEENFIHLAGFQTKLSAFRISNTGRNVNIPKELIGSKNAIDFIDDCENGTILLSNYEYRESKRTSSEKLEVLPSLLDYRYVKIYKAGKHDLITLNNKFESCIGNHDGILGFDKRLASQPNLAIPVTVTSGSIHSYCSKTQKVVAILYKDKGSDKYATVLSAVKSGIPVSDLPRHIQDMLDSKLQILIS